MSALGQKQTFAVQNVMSALPPKADMCSAHADVRFVPIADMAQTTTAINKGGRQLRRPLISTQFQRKVPAQFCMGGTIPLKFATSNASTAAAAAAERGTAAAVAARQTTGIGARGDGTGAQSQNHLGRHRLDQCNHRCHRLNCQKAVRV